MRTRRWLLGTVVAGAIAGAGAVFRKAGDIGRQMWLRPPGALPEERFLDACTRCFKCVGACPNDCLEVHGLDAGLELAFTPYLKPRARGCILCGECADVCPSGALVPFLANREGWTASLSHENAMGKARVNKDMCFSFHGRTCGACYRACPLAGTAIKIGMFETPHVQWDECVGCGLCEQACLHLPQAIRVVPIRLLGESA